MAEIGADKQSVVVTDVKMPFLSMVVFMVKWSIAAIPAVVILVAISIATWTLIAGLLISAALGRSRATVDSATPPAGSTSPAPSVTAESQSAESVYLANMSVAGVKVSDAGLGDRGVFGEIKNAGDRTLSLVEITVFFLDKNKKPISEETHNPVLVSKYSFSDNNQPLKPGYSRKFGYKADDSPSDWSGAVEVKVTKVEFAKP